MQAKFTEGSIFKHVCNMTFTSAAGLVAIFLVDLVDLYWLSLLGELELAAAIGYAGSILFFTLSLSIGLSIGCGAVVSQSIGRGDAKRTSQLVTHALTVVFMIAIPVAIFTIAGVPWFLAWLGAVGKAADFASAYLYIVLPSMPLLAMSIASSGVMRAMGAAKQAMYITLLGGAVNAICDPIFIFGFGWGIEGAAVATAVSRAFMLAYAIRYVVFECGLLTRIQRLHFFSDARCYLRTAVPAMLTNLSTPIGVAYVTAVMAQFGDSAVAGNAIISKLQPLAFAGIFALSGAIGPIAGQNFGARKGGRILRTLNDSLIFNLCYCVIACVLLFLSSGFLIDVFGAKGESAEILRFFCYGLSGIFVFNGVTFITNALFNNLNAAHWATVINFAKATLFTMPFVSLGAEWGGPVGVLVGLFIGASMIAVIGLVMAYAHVSRVRRKLMQSTL